MSDVNNQNDPLQSIRSALNIPQDMIDRALASNEQLPQIEKIVDALEEAGQPVGDFRSIIQSLRKRQNGIIKLADLLKR